ncbi:MAG: hypothetical protein ACR2QZ_16710 [Woeseiaceae bacterium]
MTFGGDLVATTGWPVPDAPRSITIVADTCVEAGIISTLAMLTGRDAENVLKPQSVKWWCRRWLGHARQKLEKQLQNRANRLLNKEK